MIASSSVVLVAAVAENGVIGRGNALPWRLKSDMAHFRALTMGKPVVMGRKTYLSIGKPLEGRTTIVVSRDPAFAAPGVVVAPSLDAALDGGARRCVAARRRRDRGHRRRRHLCAGDAGGRRGLPSPQVHMRADGDARFPAIDPKLWRESRAQRARSRRPTTKPLSPSLIISVSRRGRLPHKCGGIKNSRRGERVIDCAL